MSFETASLLVLLGVAVGGVGTLVGAGGGFLLTPVLLLVYPHDSPRTITAISLAAVWANSTSGTLAYARQRRIDLRSGIVFGIATLPGAVGGALLVRYVPRHLFNGLMAVALGAVAVLITIRGERPHARRSGAVRVIVDRAGREWRYRVPEARGVLYSVAVGFVSSFLGIGGGVIHVPLLVRALGFPTHLATATSHFVLAVMAGAGTITHAALGSFANGHGVRRAASLSVGVVAGAQLGAHISTRLRGRAITLLLAAALAALAVRLLYAV